MFNPAPIISTMTNATITANKIKKQEEEKKKEDNCKNGVCQIGK